MNESCERVGEEFEEGLQFVDVSHDSDPAEVEFVDTTGEIWPEPAFVVANFQQNVRLFVDQILELSIREESDQLLVTVPLDDETLVEERVSDFKIFHAEELADR